MYSRTAVCFLFLLVSSQCREPSCSRFDYDKNLLEMLVRLEFEMKQKDDERLMVTERLNKEEIHRKTLEEQLSVVKSEVEELRKMVKSLNQSLTARSYWESSVDKQLQKSKYGNFYFFFNSLHSFQTNRKACFKTLKLSDANWYDPSTCELTIKDGGLYHVTFSFITTIDSESPYCDLYINDIRTIHNRGKGRYQSTTSGLYVQLNKGDKLDIRCPSLWEYVHNGMGAIFSGAQIHSNL